MATSAESAAISFAMMFASLIVPPAAAMFVLSRRVESIAVVVVDAVVVLVLSVIPLSLLEQAASAIAATAILHRLSCLMCSLVGWGCQRGAARGTPEVHQKLGKDGGCQEAFFVSPHPRILTSP